MSSLSSSVFRKKLARPGASCDSNSFQKASHFSRSGSGGCSGGFGRGGASAGGWGVAERGGGSGEDLLEKPLPPGGGLPPTTVLPMQHFLNFLPLPHGQGSLRPTFMEHPRYHEGTVHATLRRWILTVYEAIRPFMRICISLSRMLP